MIKMIIKMILHKIYFTQNVENINFLIFYLKRMRNIVMNFYTDQIYRKSFCTASLIVSNLNTFFSLVFFSLYIY